MTSITLSDGVTYRIEGESTGTLWLVGPRGGKYVYSTNPIATLFNQRSGAITYLAA